MDRCMEGRQKGRRKKKGDQMVGEVKGGERREKRHLGWR